MFDEQALVMWTLKWAVVAFALGMFAGVRIARRMA